MSSPSISPRWSTVPATALKASLTWAGRAASRTALRLVNASSTSTVVALAGMTSPASIDSELAPSGTVSWTYLAPNAVGGTSCAVTSRGTESAWSGSSSRVISARSPSISTSLTAPTSTPYSFTGAPGAMVIPARSASTTTSTLGRKTPLYCMSVPTTTAASRTMMVRPDRNCRSIPRACTMVFTPRCGPTARPRRRARRSGRRTWWRSAQSGPPAPPPDPLQPALHWHGTRGSSTRTR